MLFTRAKTQQDICKDFIVTVTESNLIGKAP